MRFVMWVSEHCSKTASRLPFAKALATHERVVARVMLLKGVSLRSSLHGPRRVKVEAAGC